MFFLPSAKEENKIVVYKITNLVNGKVYWGKSTITARLRVYDHRRCAFKKNIKRPLYYALRKYGEESFCISVVAICSSSDEAYIVEQRMIKNCHIPKYNLSDGGPGATGKRTQEQCANISLGKRNSGRPRSDIGAKRGPEQIARMSAAQRKLVPTENKIRSSIANFKIASVKNSKPVWCLETGESWPSKMACAIALGHVRGYGCWLFQCVDKPTRTFQGKHFLSHPI